MWITNSGIKKTAWWIVRESVETDGESEQGIKYTKIQIADLGKFEDARTSQGSY